MMENLQISGVAPKQYPSLLYFGLFYYNVEDSWEIPIRFPFAGEWGKPISFCLNNKKRVDTPKVIDIVWLSIVEKKFYSAMSILPTFIMKPFISSALDKGQTCHIVVGMAPYGRLAIWIHVYEKSIYVCWIKAKECHVLMKDFMPTTPTATLDDLYNYYIKVQEGESKIENNGLPPRDLFDNYMKQFAFRYQVAFEKWNGDKWEKSSEDKTAPEFDYIEEALFDGTHDKLHDGGLMKYHEAGKPKKLKAQFHIGGYTKDGRKRSVQEYSAYFWFEDERIREVFDKFYGAHPDTKTDFIIKIDAEKNKYQVALYRYGLKEPTVLSDDVYQLIVFRNKFECYRSENYNQERGAWIW